MRTKSKGGKKPGTASQGVRQKYGPSTWEEKRGFGEKGNLGQNEGKRSSGRVGLPKKKTQKRKSVPEGAGKKGGGTWGKKGGLR